ncbi:phosphonate metabolism transcriptional regulator PhnF [Pelovirga terrestris]|uniref:Phosphonate metabolism transcriptional regulator PhnF n=1 Tax=Pelovirga terrestris TaxID=2771352 RepID=A0A8J6UR93_9BACT|nr:phosphonate metabolism transcriptional regulator PhnF [Pelovirga terrestris]MBD1400876.1 phosphonate metabolism transcriptional regulator PhnF [Pelovirga terrestris]
MSLFVIERNQGTAVYAQIAEILETEYVANGMPGDRLPSEARLAEQFGVNRHTLRRAVDELVAEGKIERFHGIGLFVAEQPINYKLQSKTRFTQTLGELGMSTNCDILTNKVIVAPLAVARALGLDPLAEVRWIESLRYADNIPLCVISHFVPFVPYGEALGDYRGGSLHAVLTQNFGMLRRRESLVTVVTATEEDARRLQIRSDQPLLRVKSLNVLEGDDEPVEYAVTRFRGDRIQLRIDLQELVDGEQPTTK